MSASETVRRHTFGAPEDMGPPALERAAHQLMVQEANRRIAAEKSIEQLNAALSQAKSDAQASETARTVAEAKVGELTAELLKRGEAYRAAIAEMDTKLLQEREGRTIADLLAAQARTEADGERAKYSDIEALVTGLQEQISGLMQVEHTEVAQPAEAPPISYRLDIAGRDAAGDLKTMYLVPILEKG